MSCKGKDFVDLAYSIVSGPSNSGQAEIRTAISRAYYGAFLSARDFAKDSKKVIFSSGAKVHQEVIDHYVKVDSEISNTLLNLRAKRNIADYDTTIVVPLKDARSSCGSAVKVLNLIAPPVPQPATPLAADNPGGNC